MPRCPFRRTGCRTIPPSGLDLNFQKTGKSSKVLNYGCEEYSGAGKTAMAAVSTSGCFSTSAPGAAEFTEFTQAMGLKLKNARAMAGKMPSGIPLTMDSTRTVNAGFTMPGLTPDQAVKLKEMIAKQGPQTTKTVVTKLETRDLPADTFTAPVGYERRAIGGPGAPPPSAAEAGASAGAPPLGRQSARVTARRFLNCCNPLEAAPRRRAAVNRLSVFRAERMDQRSRATSMNSCALSGSTRALWK